MLFISYFLSFIASRTDFYDCVMKDTIELEPIRVYFDLDIDNDNTKNIIRKTTENLSLYLSQLLKVRRCKHIRLLNTTIWHPKTIYDHDLYVLIKTCAFNDSKAVYTQTFTDKNSDYRPKASFIQIDINSINIDDNPRNLFDFLAHELFHALGISQNQSIMWIDPDSKLPYFELKKNPFYTCTFPNTSQKSTFISTKHIHELIKNKTGRENFGLNKNGSICPLGIEFEKNHIKSTVFPFEIMTPNRLGGGKRYISDVTLTLLKSTGYYEVNMSMAENANFLKSDTQKNEKNISKSLSFQRQNVKINSELDPETTPVPISVPVSLMKKKGCSCNTDIQCSLDPIKDFECGEKCWSSKSADDYFEYTFIGVKFEIYGSYGNIHGNFSVYLDNQFITNINLYNQSYIFRKKVFTSEIFEYGNHTIRAQGLQGQLFEIYKFTYWPSLKAKRINVSELNSFGPWTYESDKIGGARAYSYMINASVSASLYCSKIWIYGGKDPSHGKMNVKLDDKEIIIDECSTSRNTEILLYESDFIELKTYDFRIENLDRVIMLNFIYYLDYYPEIDYIDKVFINTIPFGFIKITENSDIYQISGCKFINVIPSTDFIGKADHDIEFFNNTFEYTEDIINPSVMYFRFSCTQITIATSTFKNFRYARNFNEGILFTMRDKIDFTFDRCNFINIGSNDTSNFLVLRDQEIELRFLNCSFTFDDCKIGSKIADFKISKIYFDSCKFTRCPKDFIFIEQENTMIEFIFTNNIIEGNKNRFLSVTNINYDPIIENNTFQNIEMSNGSLIQFVHYLNKIELFNNTFSQIVTGTTSYGGGIASYYQNKDFNEMTIIYKQCKFHSISNKNKKIPFNQGGAIQYGYNTCISNVFMTFDECEFIKNECSSGNGGALGININRDLTINKCLFKDNEALNRGGAIYIWCKFEKPTDNSNAPNFDGRIQMNSITISNCNFVNNKAYLGCAIFIERENATDVKFDILSCNFTDNFKNHTDFMIRHHCKDFIFDKNNVEFTDVSKSLSVLVINTAEIITISNSNFINCNTINQHSIYFTLKNDINSTTSFYNCNFSNCKAEEYVLCISKGITEIDLCTVIFDNAYNSCGSFDIKGKSLNAQRSNIIRTNYTGGFHFEQTIEGERVIVNKCTFEGCLGYNLRCFYLYISTNDLTFSNNVLKNLVETGDNGYFGSIESNISYFANAFILENITFINNSCNAFFGGGSGLWIERTKMIIFKKCNFINNTALKSPNPRPHLSYEEGYHSGDGGGIHFGFSPTVCNVSISFYECLFKQNKAVRHGGAIALQTTQKVEIIKCNFEENIANYNNNNLLLAYNNYFKLKSEGRGGAIYLNPTFSNFGLDEGMISVTIEDCKFISNKAFDGYAIYIEGDDPGTTFVINNNEFIDNFNSNTLSVNKSVVTSEIFNLYEGNVVNSNKFTYSDSKINVNPLLYVDHYGNPYFASPTQSETPSKSIIETQSQQIIETSSFESDSKIDDFNNINSNKQKNKKKNNVKKLILHIIILTEMVALIILVIVIFVIVVKNKKFLEDEYMNITQNDDLEL